MDERIDRKRPRFLIVSPNWIGDAVMAQPLLHLLQRRDPDSAIDVLAPRSVAPVWRAMPEVDTVLETPFQHGALQLAERWKFARRLRQRGYAAAYVLPNTLKYALIPWLAGIPRRIGYRGEMRYGLINVMHRDDRKTPRPMVAFYAALAGQPQPGPLGAENFPRPQLQVSDELIGKAMNHVALQAEWPMIVFAPGAEFGSAKRWPAAHFAALADSIRQSHPYAQIALLGSAKDKAVCEKIVRLAPQVRNLAGITKLGQAIALIARAEAVVSNDSGLLHIASALNRPIVALYGPTDPDHAPPFSDIAQSIFLGLDCAPCRQRKCPLGHRNCMREITTGMVWGALRPMLRN